jgi:hypothetical protein
MNYINKKTTNINMNSGFLIKIAVEVLFALFISISAFGQNLNPLEEDRNYKTGKGKSRKSNLSFKKVSVMLARNYKQPLKLDSADSYQLVLPNQQSLRNRNYKNK